MVAITKSRVVLSRRWWVLAWLLGAVLAVAASGVLAGAALAYNNTGGNVCAWSYTEDTTLRLPYRNNTYYPPSGDYAVAYSTARANWDSAATPADFVYDGSQNFHTMGVTDLGSGGPNGILYHWCQNFGKRSASHAYLNESTLKNEDATFKRSTAAHELGHYIGLRHSTVTPAIMYFEGNFYGYGVQQQDDECGVQDIYSHEDYPLECNY